MHPTVKERLISSNTWAQNYCTKYNVGTAIEIVRSQLHETKDAKRI